MNLKKTTGKIGFVGCLLGLTVNLMPQTCLCDDGSMTNDTVGIEEGLATLRTINLEGWKTTADTMGRWVCDRITATTNETERSRLQEAYGDAILAMEFDRSDWRKTEASIDRFLCLAAIGFQSFNRSEDDRMRSFRFLLTAFVRARCEIMMLEQQVVRETAVENARNKEILAWQRKCTSLGLPCKRGYLTRSGARPTIHGAQSKYEQTVSMCIDGEQLKATFRELPKDRQHALLENIRFALGRYPKWHHE